MPANGSSGIDSLRHRPPGGRLYCSSCWPSHIMFTEMKNHISKLAFVQMITQFLQACCVPLIGPSFNYEVLISQCSSIISLFLLCWHYTRTFFPHTWSQSYQPDMVIESIEGKKMYIFNFISSNQNIFDMFRNKSKKHPYLKLYLPKHICFRNQTAHLSQYVIYLFYFLIKSSHRLGLVKSQYEGLTRHYLSSAAFTVISP